MRGDPPPLPPRRPPGIQVQTTDAVPNAIVMDEGVPNDPSHSLSLPRPEATTKRRLLLIYIHGFMGSEASFNDFPAHVHHLLSAVLSESYIVYTRIYPRYKSRGEIQTAVDQFSKWLSPHEADDLDVILLGHSLGGILAADVALLQNEIPDGQPRHRIFGLINFDVPLLGVHPRVIPTGIGSLFQKKDKPAEGDLAESFESLAMDTNKLVNTNPNFDPPFRNDVRLVKRDALGSIKHFFNKNTDRISRSLVDLVLSPVQFANCVNDYPGIRMRYRRLMELEAGKQGYPGVQFVQYYTASTGRKKKPAKESKNEDTDEDEHTEAGETKDSDESKDGGRSMDIVQTASSTTDSRKSSTAESDVLGGTRTETDEAITKDDHLILETQPTASDSTLAVESPATDEESISRGAASLTSSISIDKMENTSLDTPEKLRKFILLPSHHWRSANNSLWVPVVMEDMDEVVAHQSIFLTKGKHYDELVGETVTHIEQWVQNDMSLRALS
ncbi:hypothetical protein N7454_000232 [Penicillium verhagenii]|nr:hypothetical protein N7454_000232 [Penicillium verhagenii]